MDHHPQLAPPLKIIRVVQAPTATSPQVVHKVDDPHGCRATEQRHARCLPRLFGVLQRRPALTVNLLWVGAPTQQLLNAVGAPPRRSQVQGRGPVIVKRHHLPPPSQQLRQALELPTPRRHMHRRLPPAVLSPLVRPGGHQLPSQRLHAPQVSFTHRVVQRRVSKRVPRLCVGTPRHKYPHALCLARSGGPVQNDPPFLQPPVGLLGLEQPPRALGLPLQNGKQERGAPFAVLGHLVCSQVAQKPDHQHRAVPHREMQQRLLHRAPPLLQVGAATHQHPHAISIALANSQMEGAGGVTAGSEQRSVCILTDQLLHEIGFPHAHRCLHPEQGPSSASVRAH
mmetsp:Transcript_27318/g.63425  ORF Transcript_27318/g.63425 Transcript_27318/m.63425 type:complete len:340 (-) Transcript_27318:973-1992(-)